VLCLKQRQCLRVLRHLPLLHGPDHYALQFVIQVEAGPLKLPIAISREPMMWCSPLDPCFPRHALCETVCQQVRVAGPTTRESALSKDSIVSRSFLYFTTCRFCCIFWNLTLERHDLMPPFLALTN
jgi:hypothetical protein